MLTPPVMGLPDVLQYTQMVKFRRKISFDGSGDRLLSVAITCCQW
ncbi:MAG: hypothetical protein AB4426_21770 [Xenococcaceae cyanobacterium]